MPFDADADVDVANSADELKRLLLSAAAIQPPGSTPAHTSTNLPEDQKADALLALLKGSSTGLNPPTSNVLPRTPMEQIMDPPHLPQSPHVQHVKSSPHTTRLPPPGFNLSPNQQHMPDAIPSFAQLGPKRSFEMHPGNLPSINQPSPHFPHISQSHHPSITAFAPANLMQNFVNTQPQLRPFPPQMAPSLQPQGHGAIAHGPAAPKASQLPPPTMNSHTMNLLNAFKAPSHSHQASHGQTQVHHFPSDNAFGRLEQGAPKSGPHDHQNHPQPGPYLSASSQYAHAGHAPQAEAPRSHHQNSLLDLFRSPSAQYAIPAAPQDQGQQRAASMQVISPTHNQQAASTGPSQGIPKQRSSTVAMMTRTLPRAKPSSSTNMSQHDSSKTNQTAESLFPAKNIVRQIQKSSVETALPERRPSVAEENASKISYKILSRPASKSGSNATPQPSNTPPLSAVPSPRKGRSSKAATEHSIGQNVTILQRPSPNRHGEAALSQQRASSVSTQRGVGPTESFQPQVLRRPKAGETATTSTLSVNTVPQGPSGGDQRDALLALFAKSGHGRVKSVDPRAGPPSSGSASPLPANHTSFRSRIASNASVASNGEGLRSPATPVEAKGFLMDYLNGVVKGEQNKAQKGHM